MDDDETKVYLPTTTTSYWSANVVVLEKERSAVHRVAIAAGRNALGESRDAANITGSIDETATRQRKSTCVDMVSLGSSPDESLAKKKRGEGGAGERCPLYERSRRHDATHLYL